MRSHAGAWERGELASMIGEGLVLSAPSLLNQLTNGATYDELYGNTEAGVKLFGAMIVGIVGSRVLGSSKLGKFNPIVDKKIDYDVKISNASSSGVVRLGVVGSPSRFRPGELVGRFDDGNLTIEFYKSDVPKAGHGSEMVSQAIESIGAAKVKTVSGQFGLSNKDVYLRSLDLGSNSIDAAWNKPLGKAMKK